MARFQLPLSGDVTQTINPWTWVFSPNGGNFSLLNFSVDMGPSSNPEVEAEIIRDVASDGKQIGRIEDALTALIEIAGTANLSERQKKVFAAFGALMGDIENIKDRHRRE